MHHLSYALIFSAIFSLSAQAQDAGLENCKTKFQAALVEYEAYEAVNTTACISALNMGSGFSRMAAVTANCKDPEGGKGISAIKAGKDAACAICKDPAKSSQLAASSVISTKICVDEGLAKYKLKVAAYNAVSL